MFPAAKWKRGVVARETEPATCSTGCLGVVHSAGSSAQASFSIDDLRRFLATAPLVMSSAQTSILLAAMPTSEQKGEERWDKVMRVLGRLDSRLEAMEVKQKGLHDHTCSMEAAVQNIPVLLGGMAPPVFDEMPPTAVRRSLPFQGALEVLVIQCSMKHLLRRWSGMKKCYLVPIHLVFGSA